MKYIFFITLLVLASVSLSSAQFEIGKLSDGCKNQLTQMLSDKDINDCLPITSITSIFASGKSPDPNTLKNAADSICGEKKCSDDLVAKTKNNIKGACQQEISNNNTLVQAAVGIVSLYSPIRDSVCYKNSTDGYCFIESSIAAQQILQSAPPNQDPTLSFAGAPKEEVCTPCNKAILNTFFNYQKSNPDAFSEIKQVNDQDINTAKNALTGKCGANFLDGNVGNSKESPDKFQNQASSKSDAMSLIANRMSYVAVLVGLIFSML